MTRVECHECGHEVQLPSGLALSARDENPDWKGVRCPWCDEYGDETVISAEDVAEAFGCSIAPNE